MDFGAATHPGLVRDTNEDGFFASGEKAIFAVADGMGGHAQGEVASQLALEAITRHADVIALSNPADLSTHLHQALQEANAEIIAQASDQEAGRRMGTTMVLANICGDRLYFAHIGDSRLYLLRGELFIQLTRDHSLVQAMVDRGEITPEEAAIHPLRHQITRVVGGDEDITPEIASQALEPGDQLLLCTDGLSGVVTTEVMKEVMAANMSAQQKADTLVKAAIDGGGPDNVTAVVVTYQRPRSTANRNAHFHVPHPHFNLLQTTLITAGVIVALLIALVTYALLNPSYYIAPNDKHDMALYRSWPLLPMLKAQYVYVPGRILVSEVELEPVSTGLGEITTGIPVKDKDAGVALLEEISKRVIARALDEAKSEIETRHFPEAQLRLQHARDLGADPLMVKQLEVQLELAKKTQPPAMHSPAIAPPHTNVQ